MLETRSTHPLDACDARSRRRTLRSAWHTAFTPIAKNSTVSVALALIWVLSGCAAGGGSQRGSESAEDRPYDPSRAFLTLRQIKPNPPPPPRNELEFPELSAPSQRRIARAQTFYERNRFTESVLELDKALRRDPEHPVLHQTLAKVLYAAGQAERTRKHLRKAIDLKAGDVATYYLLGRLALDDAQQSTAIRLFRIALKAPGASDDAEHVALCHYYLARALNAQGYLTAAIGAYQAYQNAVSDIDADKVDEMELATLLRMNRGRAGVPISVAYEKLGRLKEAAAALASAIEGVETDADTTARLARLLSGCGRFDEAIQQVRKIDDPQRAVQLLVEIHEHAGSNPDLILEDVASLYNADPDRIELVTAYADALVRFDHQDTAEQVLSECLQKNPDYDQLYWRLCDVYASQQKWKRLLSTAATAVRTDQSLHSTARRKVIELAEHADAILALLGSEAQPRASADDYASDYLLAMLAQSSGRQDQAEGLLASAVSRQADFIPARVELGEILLRRFAWTEAVDLASADPDQLRDDGRLQRLCGRAHAALDDFHSAETNFVAAIHLDRTDTVAMAQLAKLLNDNGQVRRARKQYEAVLKINPLDEASREELFDIYMHDKAGHHEAAQQIVELRNRSASPHRIARCTARLDLRHGSDAGDWQAYQQTLLEAIERHGPDVRTYALIGDSYRHSDEAEKALETIDQGLASEPGNAELILGRSLALEASLRYQEAIDTQSSLVDRHPNRLRWINRLAYLLLVDQQYDEAYTLASKQLKRPELSDDDREMFRFQARIALRRSHRHDDHIALVTEWQKAEPDNARWAWMLADAYNEAEQPEQAIAVAEAQYERTPDRSALYALRGTLMAAERFEQAQQVILERLEDDPDNEELIERLIRSLMAADRHDDALELIADLEIRMGDSPGLRVLKVGVFQTAKRHHQAIKLLNRWLAEEKSRAHPTLNIDRLQLDLANAMFWGGKLDEAILKLRNWANSAEDPVSKYSYLTRLSTFYQSRVEPTKAIAALEEAFALKDQVGSRAVGVHNDLGYSLADEGLRLDEAEAMIRHDLVRVPDNGAYLDSMGWVLYKKSKFESALRWLEKAANVLDRDDPVVYDHLGDVLWRLGKPDQAAKRWEKAVELLDEELKHMDRPNLARINESVQAKLETHRNGGTPQVSPVGESGG